MRNTPTCVGKTRGCRATADLRQKHPHVRGEDGPVTWMLARCKETPPRAWGRPVVGAVPTRTDGNTPTCVGKTEVGDSCTVSAEKHPHVRGEDHHHGRKAKARAETPPRAWGRLTSGHQAGRANGNTPTCVGKTAAQLRWDTPAQKHPHVRGEDITGWEQCHCVRETPPRAWGRHSEIHQAVGAPGNTPTCVGKTFLQEMRGNGAQKHPHVRGEDRAGARSGQSLGETPPRAWGRPSRPTTRLGRARNTPTCVGKTETKARLFDALWKHPHVRGEDGHRAASPARGKETPPRAWGRPQNFSLKNP